jgi:Flp pilus assembly pilin Flp
VQRIAQLWRSESGQTTAEYALVLLVVGVVVGVFITVVRSGALAGFFEDLLGRLSDGIDV